MRPVILILPLLVMIIVAPSLENVHATEPEDIHAGLFPDDGSELALTAARALVAYEACKAADPDSAATLNNLGVLYILLNELDNADDALNGAVSQALNAGYGYTGIKMNMGVASSHRQESAKANDLYNKAREDIDRPVYSALAPQIDYNLAWEAYGEYQLDDALTHVEKAIAHNLANDFLKAKAHILRGALHYRGGDLEAALADFQQAAVLDPDGPFGTMAKANAAQTNQPRIAVLPGSVDFHIAQGEVVSAYAAPDQQPWDLAFDGSAIWCVQLNTRKIHKLDLDGNGIEVFDPPGQSPAGLAYGNGFLWCSETASHKIYQLDETGTTIASFPIPGTECAGLAFDGTDLYSADRAGGKIHRLNTSGHMLASFDAPGSGITGLAFDGAFLWCAAPGDGKIFKLDLSGQVLDYVEQQGAGISGLTFDGTHLWKADSHEHKLVKLQVNGPVSVANTQIKVVEVRNRGLSNLVLGDLSLQGPQPSPFSLDRDDCSSQVLSHGESKTFEVVYAPTTAGEHAGTIQIPSNDPDTPATTIDLSASAMAGADGDQCPQDPYKTRPGTCGCDVSESDGDGDGTPDCVDECPDDAGKIAPGTCGCGDPDSDADGDSVPDCVDNCPDDGSKTEPGQCGCGSFDIDSDKDGTLDCFDDCPRDPQKLKPGNCGCGAPEGTCVVGSGDDGSGGCFITSM